ncbi:peptidoglycan-binding protein [Vreelandella populi]|nr:peptidoglycan-binding protein [Halomonas populi]
MKSTFFLGCVIAIAMAPLSANAHPGGLDANGCHGGSRPYHCHRSSSDMVRTPSGHNRLRCDLGSRSSECNGSARRSASSVSTGSGAFSTQIYQMQTKLRNHCSGLSASFVDGRFGSSTERALKRFQEIYGLQPDGIYGPNTANALNGPVNGSCTIN